MIYNDYHNSTTVMVIINYRRIPHQPQYLILGSTARAIFQLFALIQSHYPGDIMAITMKYQPCKAEKFVVSTLPNRNYDSCLIRQHITTTYASENSRREALFAGVGRSFDSSRTYIIPVPKGTSLQAVQIELDKHPDATIWKTLSHSPIMTPELENAKALGYTTDEKIEARQRVKDPDNNSKDLLDRINGAIQYHLLGFSLSRHEDVDLRTYTEEERKAYRERSQVASTPDSAQTV